MPGGVLAPTVSAAALAPAAATVPPSSVTVQNDTFGIAPTDGSSILQLRPGTKRTRSITILNRTKGPLTFDLESLAASRNDQGDYSLGAAGTGLAQRMHLDRSSVTLAGQAHTEVRVSIDAAAEPALDFGAVAAVVHGDDGSGVRQRLSVLVKVTPDAPEDRGGVTIAGTHLSTPVVVLAVLLIVGLLVGLILLVRRRRAEHDERTARRS